METASYRKARSPRFFKAARLFSRQTVAQAQGFQSHKLHGISQAARVFSRQAARLFSRKPQAIGRSQAFEWNDQVLKYGEMEVFKNQDVPQEQKNRKTKSLPM